MTAPALSEEEAWNKRRALIGLLEIARDALQTARAISEDGPNPLVDEIYTAQVATKSALEVVPTVPALLRVTEEPSR